MKTLSVRDQLVSENPISGGFLFSGEGRVVPLVYGEGEHPGVTRVLSQFQQDITAVCGLEPRVERTVEGLSENLCIVGTLGASVLIDLLVEECRLDVSTLRGLWDAFLIQRVEKPLPGIPEALVIAGSCKRGTIYGMYELSSRMGVSPWHWFADVPVKQKKALYVAGGPFHSGEPSVKYRGFFINDEYPCLGGMVHEKFGGFNHRFYAHVFDLLLRLKGNYLWPAMWADCFNDDDPENMRLADELGVIMGSSHHEPLMRSWKEWKRYGKGPWDLERNRERIEEFWRESVRRQGSHECIMTVGMRGDGDEPLTEEGREDLLLEILDTQRRILREETGKDPGNIPQMWAVYKEVQEYYDRGAKIPEDILVMLCDDNWGNIRKLPLMEEQNRPGGFGLYYHFDYVGGPRNYKWINTNPLPRVWEQLDKAYRGGLTRLWIVNAGDIKPLEYPLSFFLDYAWNRDDWDVQRIGEYGRLWAAAQFGGEQAGVIAYCLDRYAKLNGRCKAELLASDTYSLIHHREAELVLAEYQELVEKINIIKAALAVEYQDAFYQLVEFPVLASANLLELHVAAGLNRLYADQGRSAANDQADRVATLFRRDGELCAYYNQKLSGGKWSHMMDQTHISYTHWQQPDTDVPPATIWLSAGSKVEPAVAVEGSSFWWSGWDGAASVKAALPEFSSLRDEKQYLEVFNRGGGSFKCTIRAQDPWVMVEEEAITVEKQKRVWISLDRGRLPESAGLHTSSVLVELPDLEPIFIQVSTRVVHPGDITVKPVFMECDGYVSMEAEHHTSYADTPELRRRVIGDLGKTLSGVTFIGADNPTPDAWSPRLSYDGYFHSSGKLRVVAYFCPDNNYKHSNGLKYGISVDDGDIQIVNIHTGAGLTTADIPVEADTDWNRAVANSIRKLTTVHTIPAPGVHRINLWPVDSGLVLQKLVVWTGSEKDSYLGPPESYFLMD